MKFTIRNLIKYTKWSEVKRAIRYHYPKDKNDYSKLFIKLGNMPKVKTKPGEELEVYGGLDLSQTYYQEPKNLDKFLADILTGMEEIYYSIHVKDQSEYGAYSMSFVKWRYLANLPIAPDTLKHYTFTDIVAHFIWEITFYGNEKQTEKQGKEIFRTVKEVEKIKKKTF